ncbi:hypothetical protein N7460_002817 [Penicillium canescens]|uniref:Nuclear membrane fusion protein Kar5 n=1 Tax=Penicillium canescens TaxID=5083 RepID=A0AAD6IL59_PENCN|nr:hypothetical protein N7444_006462 [Penicillium canescens]KAJ6052283.1 hypothetical protein N7460_002817 [Penicillium canescens]
MPKMKAAVVSQLLFYIILPLAGSSDVRPSQKGDLPILIPKQPEIDAISSLGSGARNEDTTFKEAIQLLDSLNSSPSCNRIAATRLVVSCQAFSGGKDGTHADSPETMDLVRDGVTPPQKSRFGFVSRHKSSDNVSDKMPREVLEDCLRAIESRPQWWTSYSNSRQNALVICQASRVETEKEELLDLHRSIAKGSLKLNSGIRDALRDAVAQSEQQQLFMEAVQVLQEKIVMDMEQTDSLFQRTFGNFLREIELGIGCLQNSISSALFSLRTGTEVLEKDIHNVSSQVGALQQALQTVQQDALARNQEATLVQESNAIAHGNLAASLHLSLESLLDSDMVRIYRGMQKFDAAMEWLTSRMNMILEQETRMAERLHTMETFMHQSESKASELQTAQEQQTEALAAHSRTQEAIQFHAQVSQALLNKANIAAANLQSIIDDAAIKYKSGPGLRIEGYSAWSLCGILLLIIAAQNFKVAISLLFLILAHSMAPTILPFF